MATEPSSTQQSLQTLRVDYRKGELLESDLAADPMTQFAQWFDAARTAGVNEPNAMTFATVDADGQPSARILLMKDYDARGITFYTNYQSRKAADMQANPRVAAVFFWEVQERQVRIEGTVEKVSREESRAYFALRPRAAQVGAWASQQSAVLGSRAELEARERELSRTLPEQVPLPDHWGGYRILPTMVEFWQGRASRLHDRIRYVRNGNQWKIDRLSP